MLAEGEDGAVAVESKSSPSLLHYLLPHFLLLWLPRHLLLLLFPLLVPFLLSLVVVILITGRPAKSQWYIVGCMSPCQCICCFITGNFIFALWNEFIQWRVSGFLASHSWHGVGMCRCCLDLDWFRVGEATIFMGEGCEWRVNWGCEPAHILYCSRTAGHLFADSLGLTQFIHRQFNDEIGI